MLSSSLLNRFDRYLQQQTGGGGSVSVNRHRRLALAAIAAVSSNHQPQSRRVMRSSTGPPLGWRCLSDAAGSSLHVGAASVRRGSGR